jgi:hypothetical protein
MLGRRVGLVPHLPEIFVRTNEPAQLKRVGAAEPERPTRCVVNPTQNMTPVNAAAPARAAAKNDGRMTTLS